MRSPAHTKRTREVGRTGHGMEVFFGSDVAPAEARLVGTLIVYRFYLRVGWQDGGPLEEMFGLVRRPIRRPLWP